MHNLHTLQWYDIKPFLQHIINYLIRISVQFTAYILLIAVFYYFQPINKTSDLTEELRKHFLPYILHIKGRNII